MADDDQIAVDAAGRRQDGFSDAAAALRERFGRERHVVGVLEVCGQLTRKHFIKVFPTNTGPTGSDGPFSEGFVNLHTEAVASCDFVGRLQSAQQWRRHDHCHGSGSEVGARGPSLVHAKRRQAVSRQVGIDNVVRVLDFAVADEVDAAGTHETSVGDGTVR